MENILVIGKAIYRDRNLVFGIKKDDRRKHMYVIGKTGSGKTTLLLNMLIQDIKNGEGVAFLDSHGDAVRKVLDYIPKKRIQDVVYFNPADLDHPFAFNPLENISYEKRHIVVPVILSIFKKIWPDFWSTKVEDILNNTLLALLEYPGATLLDVGRILSNKDFRIKVAKNLRDSIVKTFWEREFEEKYVQSQSEVLVSIQNKIGHLISNPLIRNIIGQTRSSLNFKEIINEGKILLVNLSISEIGEETSILLGGFLIGKMYLTIIERVIIPENERKDFYLYIDEFQNFANESFIGILSEARKYRLNLILAHQYLNQINKNIIKAILGNIGTMIIFRVGSNDAKIFYEEFERVIPFENLINLPLFTAYIKLLVDGKPTSPFLFKTLSLYPTPKNSFNEEIIALNHLKYTTPREIVELKIRNIYFKERNNNDVICRLCENKFLSENGLEICKDCQNSLIVNKDQGNLSERNINLELKKNISENNLDSILKKLEEFD